MKMDHFHIILLLIVGEWGCEISGGAESVGELGLAEFEWDRGTPECVFDCGAAESLATRSIAYLLVVNQEEVPRFVVSSSDSEIVEFSKESEMSYSILAEAHREGEAQVILYESYSHNVLDRFEVKVRDVAEIVLKEPGLFEERLTTVAGGKKYVFLNLKDRQGNKLFGIGGVDYYLADGFTVEQVTLVSAMHDPLLTYFGGSFSECAFIEVMAFGTGSIAVEAPSGASLSIPVAIVDESVITRLALSSSGDAYRITVFANAWNGNEPVYSPDCEWTWDSTGGSVYLVFEGRDYLALEGSSSARANITCTIGIHTATHNVTFH